MYYLTYIVSIVNAKHNDFQTAYRAELSANTKEGLFAKINNVKKTLKPEYKMDCSNVIFEQEIPLEELKEKISITLD